MFGIRKTVKSVVKSVLGIHENPSQTQHWEAPDLSQVQATPAPEETIVGTPEESIDNPDVSVEDEVEVSVPKVDSSNAETPVDEG